MSVGKETVPADENGTIRGQRCRSYEKDGAQGTKREKAGGRETAAVDSSDLRRLWGLPWDSACSKSGTACGIWSDRRDGKMRCRKGSSF